METLALPTTRKNGFERTNGHFQSDLIRHQVSEWIIFCLQTKHDPPLSKPFTVHLNALLDRDIGRAGVVELSFQIFQVLIEQMKVLGIPDAYMPALRIPLELSDVLLAGPCDAKTLVQQIYYTEPPSLYLIERSLKTKMNAFEHYVFPLQASDFLEGTGFFEGTEQVYVYYSTSRSLEEIRNGWEYGRNIVAEYYPKAYQYTP